MPKVKHSDLEVGLYTSMPTKKNKQTKTKKVQNQFNSSVQPIAEQGSTCDDMKQGDDPNHCTSNVAESSVSAMTTHQLQQDKSTLVAALEMLNGLASKKYTTKEIRKRLHLQGEDQRTSREVSPDITDVPHKSKKKSIDGKKNNVSFTETVKEDEAVVEKSCSEAKLRELVNRKLPKNINFQQQLEEVNYDLSRLKYGVKGTPEFQEKSKAYKAHCDVITKMKPKVLKKIFKKISPELEDIAGQTIECERHTLFKTGKKGELKLKNVSVPFNAMQGSTLFGLLYDFLVSEMEDRPLWTEYINYVMLPEAFIRIYACANEISYELATQEMRFGEHYDGSVSVSN